MAISVEVEAPEVSTPPPVDVDFHVWGRPMRSTSQSSTWASSSVAAGDVDHSIDWMPKPAAASSPSTEAGEDIAGK